MWFSGLLSCLLWEGGGLENHLVEFLSIKLALLLNWFDLVWFGLLHWQRGLLGCTNFSASLSLLRWLCGSQGTVDVSGKSGHLWEPGLHLPQSMCGGESCVTNQAELQFSCLQNISWETKRDLQRPVSQSSCKPQKNRKPVLTLYISELSQPQPRN